MRLSVMGDFHISDIFETKQVLRDIEKSKSDQLILLGDYGRKIGTVDGIQEVYKLVKDLSCDVRPILGNHDLQRENGNGSQKPGTMKNYLEKVFNINHYGVSNYNNFRLIFISNEVQSVDECYQKQEIFITDKQYNFIKKELQSRPGVPAIMFSHAPPIACGLRTVPHTHVRATNAYIEQNHKAERWLELVKKFPEIVMWFSAHYHLGHDHFRSMTNRYGTYFIMTGVHGTSRDGQKHSRLIDIEERKVAIYTLDHLEHNCRLDWKYEGNIKDLMKSSKICSKSSKLINKQTLVNKGYDDKQVREKIYKHFLCLYDLPISHSESYNKGLISLNKDKYFMATEAGYLWEINLKNEIVSGTLHIGTPVKDLAISRGEIWWCWENKVGYANCEKLSRFIRAKGADSSYVELDKSVDCITTDSQGNIYINSGKKVWQMETDKKKDFNIIINLNENVNKIYYEDDKESQVNKGLWMLTKNGFLLNLYKEKIKQIKNNVLAYDIYQDLIATIIYIKGKFFIQIFDRRKNKIVLHKYFGQVKKIKDINILILNNNMILLLYNNNLFAWEFNDKGYFSTVLLKGSVTSIAKVKNRINDIESYVNAFCLSLKCQYDDRSYFQVWQYSN